MAGRGRGRLVPAWLAPAPHGAVLSAAELHDGHVVAPAARLHDAEPRKRAFAPGPSTRALVVQRCRQVWRTNAAPVCAPLHGSCEQAPSSCVAAPPAAGVVHYSAGCSAPVDAPDSALARRASASAPNKH